MDKKNYYVGLDMGTNSVGWAVTDTQYNLIRVKGQDFWGIREFDEAKTSVERRTKRISRRRRQREQVRINIVKNYFADAISKEDSLFFLRLENSKYFAEDKDDALATVDGVFADADYHDVDYYREYPTIFHLRKALIEDSIKNDNKYARLVFLALNNMFKHRGHFLDGSISDRDSIISVNELYPVFVEKVDEILTLSFPTETGNEFQEILSDRNISRMAKAEEINKICGFGKANKKEILLVKCLCGLKIDLSKIFEDIESEEKVEICFNDFSYDEKIDEIVAAIGDDNYELIDIMKQIFDAGSLAGILKGNAYLSYARVKEYEKHHNDLKLLKDVYREYCGYDKYVWMFKSAEAGSYSAYVNTTNSSSTGKIRRSMGGRTRDDLYKNISKSLKGIEDERVSYILDEISNETFLPKQLTPGNGVIPNQVHKMEMQAILNNAEKYLPFLKETDESGLTCKERILQLFSFQIPYYVGPTSENSGKFGGNGWVIRRESGQVLPWNLNDKIDLERTQEEFIHRLIRDCTFLAGEKVLPKNSLIYESYCVLNELNNLKIDGEKISVSLKQDIYIDIFQQGKKVTRTNLVKYLINKGVVQQDSQVSGIDENINNSLSSYGKFKALWGENINKDSYKKCAERIIYLSTIFGDSKKTLKAILKKEFADKISDADVKRILGFKFKDWGKLSREMLELEGCDKETGEKLTIFDALWQTNNNFMMLINSDEFTFKEELKGKQFKLVSTLSDFSFEDLEEFYFSAPVKRMVWQTILLLKEIQKVMGCAPDRIFIEMTRSDDEKNKGKRKDSRSKQLIELYKAIKDEKRDWEKEIQYAGDDGSLRSKKLYLYYTQMGRCMYTGQPIELDDLFSTKYDIDHIYPRHFVKDDNISNNLVLVCKTSNAYKSDNYPLPKMDDAVYGHWKFLYERKLISDEKYRRLTGRNPFSEEQKAGFIARQLVETSQGTKGVADLLTQLFSSEGTKIVYAKARNVSDFRNDNEFYKSRTINDFHHAKDAYLNIVVGNVYFTKFTENPLNFIKKEYSMDEKKNHYNLGRMFDFDVKRGDYVAWIAPSVKGGKDGTIATVSKIMGKNTPLMTRLTFEATGVIANENLSSAQKAKADSYIPSKTKNEKVKDVTKYGGYNSVMGAYFFLVEHTVKNARIRTLEMLPIYLSEKVKLKSEALIEYCIKDLGLNEPKICIAKINIQSLVEINGFRVRLSGRTGKQIILRNEVQLALNTVWNNYIHKIDKYFENGILDSEITPEKNKELFDILTEKHLNGIFSKRMNPIGQKLQEGKDIFLSLTLTDQCKVISQILLLSASGCNTADLSLLNCASMCGKMRCNQNIDFVNSFKIVNQSVTGIYETTREMAKL